MNHGNFFKLVDKCKHDSTPLVIGMYSNSHHPLWGSADTNVRGVDLSELFISKNLMVMNWWSEPTFKRQGAESVIDITVMNNAALNALNLTDWHVGSEPSMSDHRYINFNMGSYVPYEENCRNLKKANWERFKEILSTAKYPEVEISKENIDESAMALERFIQGALNIVCPLKKQPNVAPIHGGAGSLTISVMKSSNSMTSVNGAKNIGMLTQNSERSMRERSERVKETLGEISVRKQKALKRLAK